MCGTIPWTEDFKGIKRGEKERSQTEYQYSSSFCFLPTVSWNVLFLLIMMTVNSGTMVKNIPTLCPWSYLFSYFAIAYKSKQFIIHLLLFLFAWEIASEKSHIKALVFKVVVLRGKIRRPSDHKCLNFIGGTYTLYISKVIWSWALPGRSSSALWQVVSFWFEYYYISFFKCFSSPKIYSVWRLNFLTFLLHYTCLLNTFTYFFIHHHYFNIGSQRIQPSPGAFML